MEAGLALDADQPGMMPKPKWAKVKIEREGISRR
jgi:hypothetical protein